MIKNLIEEFEKYNQATSPLLFNNNKIDKFINLFKSNKEVNDKVNNYFDSMIKLNNFDELLKLSNSNFQPSIEQKRKIALVVLNHFKHNSYEKFSDIKDTKINGYIGECLIINKYIAFLYDHPEDDILSKRIKPIKDFLTDKNNYINTLNHIIYFLDNIEKNKPSPYLLSIDSFTNIISLLSFYSNHLNNEESKFLSTKLIKFSSISEKYVLNHFYCNMGFDMTDFLKPLAELNSKLLNNQLNSEKQEIFELINNKVDFTNFKSNSIDFTNIPNHQSVYNNIIKIIDNIEKNSSILDAHSLLKVNSVVNEYIPNLFASYSAIDINEKDKLKNVNGKSANELFYHSLKDIESILLETNNYILSTINNEKISNLSISARRISMAK